MKKKTYEEVIDERIKSSFNSQVLDLSKLSITEIPKKVWNNKRLRAINLSYNNITEISDKIAQFTNLEELYLGDNKIRYLPNIFNKLKELRILNIRRNPISEIPASIVSTQHLEELNISRLYFDANSFPIHITLITSLRSLDLSENDFNELPLEIEELSQLRKLILGKNGISRSISTIFGLKNLEILSLGNTAIKKIPIDFVKLSNLKSLYIGGNEIESLPNNFDKLSNLEILTLSNNAFNEFPQILTNLLNLKELALSDNMMSIIPVNISKLSKLKKLKLSQNRLEKFPEAITRLKNLERLDLSRNQIRSFPDFFDQMPNLTSFILYDNEIKNIPNSIYMLPNLGLLDLRNNQIKKIPSSLFQLRKLKEVLFENNPIFGLPDITDDSEVQTINLNNTYISEFPKTFGKFKLLKKLLVNNSNLNGLPSSIGQLSQLEVLEVSRNNIEFIPNEIKDNQKLRHINFSSNKIKSFPNGMLALKNLKVLNCANNPIPIPPEILGKIDEPQAILNYFYTVLGGPKKPINEIKIIIVGQGSVGKTSLINRVVKDVFSSQEEKTSGIAITKWELLANNKKNIALDELFIMDPSMFNNETQIPDEREKDGITLDELFNFTPSMLTKKKNRKNNIVLESNVRLNIWDFGGQEIMHATHQFFLTKRSLYILVLDSRLTQEENRVEYWLKIIQSFGGSSPVLIVGNKIDQHPLDIDSTGLQKKYPNIVGILKTSAATGAGIETLKAAITEQVNNLPHVRDLLPETWFTVKTKLEELGKQSNFITQEKYIDLCAENEVSDETSQRTLIGFLHDLGVVLHFQDDPRLEALGILNPQWVTNGVYKILNSHTLFQNKGVLTTSMLDEILNLPEYPRGKRLFIVDMMKKFELCYDIQTDKTFLVPDLLPKDQPELKFNGVPAFEYAYPVLPSSVITRFIVRMNQKIDDGFVWRTGVVLKIGENKALVKADIEDRKITIAIEGVEHTRRDALSAIRFQLDEIHGSIKGLDAQKRVPIPDAPNAEPLDYDYLLQLERDGELEVLPVKDGNRLVKVNVRKLLSGVVSETERRQSAGNTTIINIGGDVSGNIIAGDENEVNK